MNHHRGLARPTGVLFRVATVVGIAAAVPSGPDLGASDILDALAQNKQTILFTAFLVMVMGFSCAGIGISLYPVLKCFGPGWALGAAGFRILEGTLQVVSSIGLVALLAVWLIVRGYNSPFRSCLGPDDPLECMETGFQP